MKTFAIKTMLLCLCISFFSAGCSNSQARCRYSVDTRIMLSTSNTQGTDTISSSSPPNDLMAYTISEADLIFEGQVVSDGVTDGRLLPGTKELPERFQFKETTTVFTVSVEKIWFGEYDGDTLTIEILGNDTWGVSKPHKNDQGIFMVRKYGDEGNFTLSCAENSIFIKNPPTDQLYAFSSIDDFAAFDGKECETLYQAVENKLEEIVLSSDENEFAGEVEQLYRFQKQKQLQNEKSQTPKKHSRCSIKRAIL